MSTSTHVITPDLQAKLDKAREEHKNGENLCFSTAQDAIAWMERYRVANRLLMDEIPVSIKTYWSFNDQQGNLNV